MLLYFFIFLLYYTYFTYKVNFLFFVNFFKKLTLEDQVFRLILRINSWKLCSNVYGNPSTHRVNLPFFSSPPFPSVKFMKNGVFGQETFVARWRSGFFSIFKTWLPFIVKKTTEADISCGFIFFPAALASCGFEFKIFYSLVSSIELMRELVKKILIKGSTI